MKRHHSSRRRYEDFRTVFKKGGKEAMALSEEEKEKQKRPEKPARRRYLRDYVNWLRPHTRPLVVLFGTAVIVAGLDMAHPLFMRYIIDQVLLTGPESTESRLWQLNVAGAFLCAREAVRRLSTRHGGRGGSIVNISSLAARYGGAGEWIHYAASKGAIDSLTVGLAREVAGEGIRVNAVAPGLVETELHAAAGAPDRALRLGPSIPMGRAGVPEEIAEGVLWLLSSASSYVTGAILAIGGGR